MTAKYLQRRKEVAMNAAPSPEGTKGIRTQSTTSSSSKARHPSDAQQESQTSSQSSCRPFRQCWPNGSSIASGLIEAGKRLVVKARAMLRWNTTASTPSSLPANDPSVSPTMRIVDSLGLVDWMCEQARLSAANYPAAMRRLRSLEDRTLGATERSQIAFEKRDSSSERSSDS